MTEFINSLFKDIQLGTGQYKVGNDVLYLPNFYNSLNDLFINKVFTEKEKEYADQFSTPELRYASTFSAKESVYKAIKQCYPEEKIGFKCIEILREKPGGMPMVIVHHSKFGGLDVSISISHDGDYVWAVAAVKYLNLGVRSFY